MLGKPLYHILQFFPVQSYRATYFFLSPLHKTGIPPLHGRGLHTHPSHHINTFVWLSHASNAEGGRVGGGVGGAQFPLGFVAHTDQVRKQHVTIQVSTVRCRIVERFRWHVRTSNLTDTRLKMLISWVTERAAFCRLPPCNKTRTLYRTLVSSFRLGLGFGTPPPHPENSPISSSCCCCCCRCRCCTLAIQETPQLQVRA